MALSKCNIVYLSRVQTISRYIHITLMYFELTFQIKHKISFHNKDTN